MGCKNITPTTAHFHNDTPTAGGLAEECLWEAQGQDLSEAEVTDAAGVNLLTFMVSELNRAAEQKIDAKIPHSGKTELTPRGQQASPRATLYRLGRLGFFRKPSREISNCLRVDFGLIPLLQNSEIGSAFCPWLAGRPAIAFQIICGRSECIERTMD
jgi:hypothetical protein